MEVHDASILFGLGPARGSGPEHGRIERVQQALAQRLHRVRWARQVHGAEPALVTGSRPEPVLRIGEFDALATAEAGLGLLVWTADCVPMGFVGRGCVAIAHAGWRGSAAGIARRVVECLDRRLGAPAASLSVVLGPAISAAHYQVGSEVIAALEAAEVDARAWLDGDRVDLRGFLSEQLRNLGVGAVRTVGGCTHASPELASYRRDGEAAGRQWSLVYRPATDHQRSNGGSLPTRPTRA